MKHMWYIPVAILTLVCNSAEAGNYCGDLKNDFGPFDYRNRTNNVASFDVVEHAHFTADVENGIKGATSALGGDLDYTLRAIPNHTKALATMARYAVRVKTIQLNYAKYPVECYFDRAMRFAPNDGAVLAEYANYLYALGRSEDAFKMYRGAARLDPDNPTIAYNLGLAYFRQKDYAKASEFAQIAYAKGFPLPGLRKKLTDIGKWVPPAPIAAPMTEPVPASPVEPVPASTVEPRAAPVAEPSTAPKTE